MTEHVVTKKPCRRCGSFRRYIRPHTKVAGACFDCPGKNRTRSAATRLRGSFNSARKRATERDLAFTIELDKLTIPERCPVLGVPVDVPSIDRDDPTKGYTPDNVTVMSWRANNLKADGTLAEFIALTEYLKRTG